MLSEGHLLIAKHTRRYRREEHYVPGPTIDRANKSRWAEEGCQTLGQRAQREVERLVAAHQPVRLGDGVKKELGRLMSAAARTCGLERLPVGI
jgi:trimethylamine:corrinoid methyltransferase-like protein